MKLAESEAKKKWMKENSSSFSIRLMSRTEADIIDYLDKMTQRGVGKGTILKLALREYMANHPEENGGD